MLRAQAREAREEEGMQGVASPGQFQIRPLAEQLRPPPDAARLVKDEGKQVANEQRIRLREQASLTEVKEVKESKDAQESQAPEDIAAETEFANAVASLFDTRISFSYDDRINSVVVKVTKEGSEEVIRQIPAEEMIDLRARLKEGFQGLIFNKTG